MSGKKSKAAKTVKIKKVKAKKERRKFSWRAFGELLVDNVLWLFACLLYAVAINIFNVPNNIAQGGISGLAIVVNFLTGLPVGMANLLMNIPLLILAWIFLGRKFVGKTIWVTVLLSVTIDVVAIFSEPYVYTGDRLLAAIFGGALSGAGVAIALIRGATTGGTDIMGRLLHRVWPHVSMGKVIMASDAAVVLISAIVFKSVESALYAAIVIFVSSVVIDKIVYGVDKGKMLMVVTDKADEIAKAITGQTTRGVSILPVVGGYTGKEKSMIVCVLRSHEVAKINRIIKNIDANTFTIITEATEILGQGFKSNTGG